MGRSSLGPSLAGDEGEAQPTRRLPLLAVATTVVAGAVAGLAAASWWVLHWYYSDDAFVPVMQDVLKTAYQALAVGALGGLAKVALDSRRAADRAKAELRERRRSYMAILVDASHGVENARLLITSNRSVKTWTEQVNTVLIPARTRLRSAAHDLVNWAEQGEPVFPADDRVLAGINAMAGYLLDLINEHAEQKASLAEVQRRAEAEQDDGARAELLGRVWSRLQQFEVLGDLLDDGPRYGAFRGAYLDALGRMRSSLR